LLKDLLEDCKKKIRSKNWQTIQIELNFGFFRNHHQAIARRWYSGLITRLVDNAHPQQDRNDARVPTPAVIYVREIDHASEARPISVSAENSGGPRASIKGSGSGKGIRASPAVVRRGSGRRKLFINHRGVYLVVRFNGRTARCVKPLAAG